MPDRGNGSERRDDRPKIDRWETIKVLHSGLSVSGQVSMIVEVERPVFEDQRSGRPTMSCLLKRGERALRIPCKDGSMNDVLELRKLLAALTPDLVKEMHDSFDSIVEAGRQSHRDGGRARPRPGEPGGGLGAKGKTDRKRHRGDDRPA